MRRAQRMAKANRPLDLAGGGVTHERVFHERDLGIEHCDIDVLPQARAVAFDERGENTDGGVHTATHIADGVAGAGRVASGVPGHAHHPAHTLDDGVDGAALAVRSGVPEAGSRGVDQSGFRALISS